MECHFSQQHFRIAFAQDGLHLNLNGTIILAGNLLSRIRNDDSNKGRKI